MNWNCWRAILNICIIPIVFTSSFQHGRLIHHMSGIHHEHQISLSLSPVRKRLDWDTGRQKRSSTIHTGIMKCSQRLSRSSLQMVSYDELMKSLPSKAVIDTVEKSPSTSVVASGKFFFSKIDKLKKKCRPGCNPTCIFIQF